MSVELTAEKALREEMEISRQVDGLHPEILRLAEETALSLGRDAVGAGSWLKSLLVAAGRSASARELRLFAEYRMATAEHRPARAASEKMLTALDELEVQLGKLLAGAQDRTSAPVKRRCRQLLFGYLVRHCEVAATKPWPQEQRGGREAQRSSTPRELAERASGSRAGGPGFNGPARPTQARADAPREERPPASPARRSDASAADGPSRRRRRRRHRGGPGGGESGCDPSGEAGKEGQE